MYVVFLTTLHHTSTSTCSVPGLASQGDFQGKSKPAVEDEEEIFFGPVGHKERCISAAVEQEIQPDSPEALPLTAQQYAQLFVEAQTIAVQIQSQTQTQNKSDPSSPQLKSAIHPVPPQEQKTSNASTDSEPPNIQPSPKTCKRKGDSLTKLGSPAKLDRISLDFDSPPDTGLTQELDSIVTLEEKPPAAGLKRSSSLRLPRSSTNAVGVLVKVL